MGRQIAIVQSLGDEALLINELNKKFDLKCLPKGFKIRETIPGRPGDFAGQKQMIFLAKEEAAVVSNIRPVEDDPATFLIYPYEGLCIEWLRTKREGKKNYPGRFYFDTSSGGAIASEAELLKVYSFIVSKIKSTHPSISDEKHPTYVGMDLFNQVVAKKAEVNWGNGTQKKLIINQHTLNDHQKLQTAVGLPTHELALKAFAKVKDINERSEAGKRNILHYMVSEFDSKCLRVADFKSLIEIGADVNARDKEGQTPLHATAKFPKFELAEMLVANGAEIEAQDNIGFTPLFRAVADYRGEEERLKVILMLLEKGANIDRQTISGSNARKVIMQRKEAVEAGWQRKEWDLSGHLREYLA